MVLDNHRAHRGDRIPVMESFCSPMFIPSYSCCLNEPVEAAWAVLKQKVLPVFTKLSIRNTASRKNCIKAVWREIARIDG